MYHLGRVDKCQIYLNARLRYALAKLLAIQTIGLARAALEKVTFVGALMKLLGYREHHLNATPLCYALLFVGNPDIAIRIDKATTPLTEHSAYGLQ